MIFTPYDAAAPLTSDDVYSFSINRLNLAQQLRIFADALDAIEPKVLVQKITVAEEACDDDFPMTTLTVLFYDATYAQKRKDKLYGVRSEK